MRELGKKAERVGNFRLFRTFAPCGAKERVDAVKVTSLDGSWGVVIPMTIGMYNIIVELFENGGSEEEAILNTIFCNWYAVTCIAEGQFHMDIQKAQADLVGRMSVPEDVSEDEYKRMEMLEEARDIINQEENAL